MYELQKQSNQGAQETCNAAMNMIRANAAGDEVLDIFRTRRGEPQGAVEWDFFPNTKRQARVEEEHLERQARMEMEFA